MTVTIYLHGPWFRNMVLDFGTRMWRPATHGPGPAAARSGRRRWGRTETEPQPGGDPAGGRPCSPATRRPGRRPRPTPPHRVVCPGYAPVTEPTPRPCAASTPGRSPRDSSPSSGPRFLERLYRRISATPPPSCSSPTCQGARRGVHRRLHRRGRPVPELPVAGRGPRRCSGAAGPPGPGVAPGAGDPPPRDLRTGPGPPAGRPNSWRWPSTRPGRGRVPADGWWRPSSRRSAARGCAVAPRGGGSGQRRAVALYQRAGFVAAERFELHPGTESLLMQWDGATPPAPTGAVPG